MGSTLMNGWRGVVSSSLFGDGGKEVSVSTQTVLSCLIKWCLFPKTLSHFLHTCLFMVMTGDVTGSSAATSAPRRTAAWL